MPDQFWQLTPAELFIISKGYFDTQKQKAGDLLFLAWHIEAFARTKTLPPLKNLLQQVENAQQHHEQTDEEMLAMVKILNAAYGGEVVEV